MKASNLNYIISNIDSIARELKGEQEGFVFGSENHRIYRDLQDDLARLGEKIVRVCISNDIDFDVADSYEDSEAE